MLSKFKSLLFALPLLTLSLALWAAQSAVYFPGQADGVNADARTVGDGSGNKRMVFVVGDSTTTANVAPVDKVAGLATELRNTTLASYSGSGTVATATGTVCAVYGSATKTVKVTRAAFSGTQTTAGNVLVTLKKFSTINTGLVASTPTLVAMDSANSAATGYAVIYTTNPTSGSLVGVIRASTILVAAPATTAIDRYQELWGYPDQPIVLRGVAEHVDLAIPVTNMIGLAANCNFTWTEE